MVSSNIWFLVLFIIKGFITSLLVHSLAEPDPCIAQAMGLVTYAYFTRKIGMQLKARKNKISRNYIIFHDSC